MKIWEKENSAKQGMPALLEKFTIGRDNEFDLLLAEHDVIGSLAHTKMLAHIGLLTEEELSQVQGGLYKILEEIQAGNFVIEDGVEDIHSQVEFTLTKLLGEGGKKIHSGRSRNDQVALERIKYDGTRLLVAVLLRSRCWRTWTPARSSGHGCRSTVTRPAGCSCFWWPLFLWCWRCRCRWRLAWARSG